jgi:HD-GYP domain-containing protein (c-di-GMP phosphodiesterase class II)
LTEDEFQVIKNHTKEWYGSYQRVGMLWRKSRANVRPHHEKFDGEAYHQGLASEDISLFARICKLTDIYDALTTRRSYKRSLKTMEALTIMKPKMRHEFDPKLLNAFMLMMLPEA